MSHLTHTALLTLTLLLLPNPAATQDGARTNKTTSNTRKSTVTFGVYTTDKPATMIRKFKPITSALSTGITKLTGQKTDVQLRVYMSYEAAQTALVKGHIDMARFGPASYVLAKARNRKVELLAMESKKGKRTFKGLIVVRADNPIANVAALRGKTFAFGDKDSTVGRFLSQEQLLQADITAKDLASHEYLGRHDKVFRAVQLKQFVAGALKSSTFKKMNTKKQLRVLVDFDVPTKPWVARSGLPASTLAAMRKAMLEMKDKAALASLKITGFLPTKDSEYATVRASMLSTMKFGGSAVLPVTKPAPKPVK